MDGCRYGAVTVDNTQHPKYTVLSLEVDDYPGLLRVLSWVLNGMSVRVHHGILDTKDGAVKDTLWLTDYSNRKLKDGPAAALAERLQDFMLYCSPKAGGEQQEWRCGYFEISNMASPSYTQVIIKGEPASYKPGFLLELASALTSSGASIQHAVIQGSADDAPQPVADPSYDFKRGRYFEFLLCDPATGGKLGEDRIASLVFTLGLIGGQGHMPTVAPNMEALLSRF